MALVTNITKRVDIPHEPENWIEFRKLSWRQLEQASDAKTNEVFERMKHMGGDILSAVQNAAADTQAQQDPVNRYDRGMVLRQGIIRWSYDEEVTPQNIDLLDEETAEWAFREILSLNHPRTDDERKNDS